MDTTEMTVEQVIAAVKSKIKRGPRVMFYRCLKAVVKPLFFLLFRVKLIGKENGRL